MKAETTYSIVFLSVQFQKTSASRFCISSHFFIMLALFQFPFIRSIGGLSGFGLNPHRCNFILCCSKNKTYLWSQSQGTSQPNPCIQCIKSSCVFFVCVCVWEAIILKGWCWYLSSNCHVYLVSISVTKDVMVYNSAPAIHLRLIPWCIF